MLAIATLACGSCAAPNLSRTVGRGNGELPVADAEAYEETLQGFIDQHLP